MRLKRLLAVMMILAGIIITSYPFILENLRVRQQRAILNEQLQIIQSIEVTPERQEPMDEDMMAWLEAFKAVQVAENQPAQEGSLEQGSTSEQAESIKVSQPKRTWPVEAIMSIDRINLLLPVIKGATEQHLNISVSSLDNTGKPWTEGNYAIAGHRSRQFGMMFNRLDELEVGDIIVVTALDKTKYTYRVVSDLLVHESEVWVLENRGIQELTLITCDPIGAKNPDTRLVIIAELIQP